MKIFKIYIPTPLGILIIVIEVFIAVLIMNFMVNDMQKELMPEMDNIKTAIFHQTTNANVNQAVDTADWQTYRNEEWGYQVRIPPNWGQISEYDGSFSSSINPSASFVFLGDPVGDERMIIDILEIKEANKDFVGWYIDNFVHKSYEKRSFLMNSYKTTELYFLGTIGLENKYTYLIERGNRKLVVISFYDKSDNIVTILSTFQFLPDTSDWQTYTNNDYKFLFRYPDTLVIATDQNRITLSEKNKDSTLPKPLTIFITDNKDSLSVADWLAKENTSKGFIYYNQREDFIGEYLTGIKIKEEGDPDHFNYYFSSNGYIFQFSIINESFENIIKTFQILVDTSDWQTYRSDELGITFKYPKEWGEIITKKIDSSQNVNQTGALVESGKAIDIAFSSYKDNWEAGAWIRISSKDFRQFMGLSYNGDKKLSQLCMNPGIIENNSFCVSKTVAGQVTIDRVYYEAPECSPHYIREVLLNLSNQEYQGMMIAQNFSSDVSCTATESERSNVIQAELNKLLNRKDLDSTQLNNMHLFDLFLSTFQFTD